MSFLNLLKQAQAKKTESSSSPGEPGKFMKMPQGVGFKTVRLLGPVGCSLPYVELHNHYVGNGDTQQTLGCPNDHSGKWTQGDCPLCAEMSRVYRERMPFKANGNTAKVQELSDLATKLRSVERFLWNVLDRDDNTVKIWSAGKKVHEIIVKAIMGDESIGEPGLGDVTDPTSGRDFKIIKSMRGVYANYDFSKFLDVSPLAATQEAIDAILAARHNLQGEVKIATVEELEKALAVILGPPKRAEYGITASDSRGTVVDKEDFFSELENLGK